MNLEFKRSTRDRKSQAVVFVPTAEGYRGSIRVSKTLFRDQDGPESFALDLPQFREPSKPMTPEERKAKYKSRPKLTDEQKLQKLEKQLEKQRARVAAKAQQAEAVPA